MATSERIRRPLRVTTGVLTASVLALAAVGVPAAADPGPASPTSYVVGVGDSFISGEGGGIARFGGQNHWWITTVGSSLEQTYSEALTPTDAAKSTGEKCHRSKSALMNWGDGIHVGVNLACSGATSWTQGVKPGVDFSQAPAKVGQAQQLMDFARKARLAGDTVSVVSLSIGGNDIGFKDIVSDCVARYVKFWLTACSNPSADSTLNAAMKDKLAGARAGVQRALENITRAMGRAGYPSGSYVVTVMSPPAIIPKYAEVNADIYGGDSGFNRADYGGCPFVSGDFDYVNTTLMPTLSGQMINGAAAYRKTDPYARIVFVRGTDAFKGHEICSKYADPDQSDGDNHRWIADGTGFGLPATATLEQLMPNWTDPKTGGQKGGWVTPIMINCVQDDGFCDLGDSPGQKYPYLWNQVDGPWNPSDCGWQWNSWKDGDCGISTAHMQQMPMHPNFWGQRALAACHQQAASDPANVGRVIDCRPSVIPQEQPDAALPLDEHGRPSMRISVAGPIAPQSLAITRR